MTTSANESPVSTSTLLFKNRKIAKFHQMKNTMKEIVTKVMHIIKMAN